MKKSIRAEQSRVHAYTDRIYYHVQALVVVVVDGIARREREQEQEKIVNCDVADDETKQVRKGKERRDAHTLNEST